MSGEDIVWVKIIILPMCSIAVTLNVGDCNAQYVYTVDIKSSVTQGGCILFIFTVYTHSGR